MSNSIDERVVNMKFNNSQFESGISTSLNSIDKLKKGMNFDSATKSLSSLNDAGKKFSLAGIADGVATISSKFTALGIMGVTALQNITNAAISTGEQIIKSLTIDPVQLGLSEYELKINSIQTIMASTGETLSTVNSYLAELTEYANKTIYSLSDMTSNISKFTNAGVGLEDAVAAIEGVSNEAAISGANATEASRAMYNFAQALSAGYVKLIDWKSIENANMATIGFKNQLIATAVEMGTLTETADGYYKTLSGTVMGATKNFNDSLQDQWMTSDVLISTLKDYADETTDIGKSAIAAATEVKTFSQLLDVLKESAQAGWSDTFELIIGNFDEAKALMTELNDGIGSIINSATEARNEMLQVWKDKGGRDDLLQGFRNLAEALKSVVTPVKEAFREIFPAMTGEKLADITAKFKDFTAKLKIGDETASKIKAVFKGFFSVLSIGKQAVVALAKGIKTLITYLSPLYKWILNTAASFGTWVSKVNDSVKKGDVFGKVFEKLRDIMIDVADKIKAAFDKIVSGFESFTGIDLSSLDSFVSSVKEKFHPIEKIGEVLNKVFTFIGNLFKKLGPIFSKVGSTIGSAVKNMNFTSLLQLFTTGTFATAIVGITKLISSFKKITDNAGGVLSSIKSILDGVRGCLEAYQNNIKASVILKIAAAIGILAVALLAISMIDADKMNSAIAAMTVLFGELFGSMSIFEKVAGNNSFKNIKKVTKAMILLGAAILILSLAAKTLAELDWNGVAKGLLGVSVLIAELIVTSKLLSKESAGMIKSGASLLIFAVAIRVLTSSVIALSKIDTDALINGMLALLGVLGMLSMFMIASKASGLTAADAVGLVGVAMAVRIMAGAIKTLADLDINAIGRGLVAIGTILTEIAIFTQLTGSGKGLISTATAMIGIAVAMVIFAMAVKKFGSMDPETLAKGLIGLSVALLAVTLAVNFMPKNMAAIGLGMVGMSIGLLLIAAALKIMGSMSWESIAKGLTTLAVSLAILVVAVNLMNGAIVGAAAMLIISAALIGMAVALKILGSMSLASIGKALLALAGVLIIFGAAALVLAPILPAMAALAAILILLDVGLAGLGAASIVLAMGLSALASSGMKGVLVLLALGAACIPLGVVSPLMVVAAIGLLALAGAVAALGAAAMVLGAGMAVIAAVGDTGLAALTALAATAVSISQFAVQLLAAGAGLLLFGAGALVAGAGALVAGVGILVLAAGLKKLSTVSTSNFDGIVGLSNDFLKASGILLLAAPGLLAGGAALVVFGDGAKSTGEGLASIQNGITEVVNSVKSTPATIEEATSAITDGITSLTSNVKNSLSDLSNQIIVDVSDMVSSSVDEINSYWSSYEKSGEYLVGGFSSGIRAMSYTAAQAAAGVAASALKAANRELQISSPSKVFEKTGMYADLGLAKGLDKYSQIAVSAAQSVGQSTITPVMDMANNVLSGTNTLGTGIQKIAEKATGITQTVETNKTVTMKHTFDTLHVEGVNDKKEFVAAADYSVEELTSLIRRQSRV